VAAGLALLVSLWMPSMGAAGARAPGEPSVAGDLILEPDSEPADLND
jgi:hypothetical protein